MKFLQELGTDLSVHGLWPIYKFFELGELENEVLMKRRPLELPKHAEGMFLGRELPF